MAAFCGIGNTPEAQGLIKIGGKNSPLFRTGYHRGCQEESLVQGSHKTEIGAHLLTQSGSGEPESAAADALCGSADIAADGGKTAAGVLNQASNGHIRPHIRGFDGFHKLTVAVVHHNENIRLHALAEGDQLTDLLNGKGGTGGVALGALDGDELRLFIDGLTNGGVVEAAVGQQIHLPVGHTVLGQGAGALPDADNLLEGIVRHATGESSSSPGSRLALRATVRAWVPQVI